MNELENILASMDVPPLRRKDLGWLKRNLAVRNRDHPEFHRAMRIIHDLLENKD
jgi:hypothetical protein